MFEANSPLGHTVYCSQSVWNDHIVYNHKIMCGKEDIAIAAIEAPMAVFESDTHTNRDVYFGEFVHTTNKALYTKVIVENNKEGSTVITAFPQENISGNIKQEVLKYVRRKL